MSATLIISDMHLGQGKRCAKSAQALAQLWRSTPYEPVNHVICNGDTAEVHHPFYRDRAREALHQLQQLADSDGVKLTLICGNHDPAISDKHHALLADGQVFVTHGHVFHEAQAPWCVAGPQLLEAFRQKMAEFEGEDMSDFERICLCAEHASAKYWQSKGDQPPVSTGLRRAMCQPTVACTILKYWHQIPRDAAHFAQLHVPRARFVVFGHSHRQGIWHRAGRTILNTGSFGFPGKPFGIVLRDHALCMHRIRQSPDGYRLSEKPIRSYALSQSKRGEITTEVCDAATQQNALHVA